METVAAIQPPPPALPRARHRAFPVWEPVKACWPAAVVTLGFLILLAVTVRAVHANEGGRYAYTVDDSYFHMAVAKNLLRHGIWGVSAPDGFSSGTSSLLWPLLITACFAAFGIREYFPLVLNVLAAVGLIFYAGQILRRTTGSGVYGLLVLAAIVLLAPTLAVASTGMEHSLQALLGVIFVDLAARLLTADAQSLTSKTAQGGLCAVATLLVMTRYEGLFLVAPVGLLLLCQRRWVLAISLGIAAAAPVVLYGLFAVSKGWYFLPNSLLLKGNTQLVPTAAGLFDYFSKWYAVMGAERHMFTLVAATAAALLGSLQRRRTLWSYPALFLFITLLAMIQHLQFAGIGWFYRYEAYLIVLGVLGVGIALGYEAPESGGRYWLTARALPHYAALGFAAVLFGPPLWVRGIGSIHHVVTASYNVYEQQYQMGHFVRKYYGQKGVAANDVGAISFYGDIDLLDTYGLSDIDVLRARRTGPYNWETIRRLSRKHHVEMVAIYDIWSGMFGGPLPEWVLVGRWRIQNNTIVGSNTVSFYAPGAEFVAPLTRHLQEFGATLPRDIVQDGTYCGAQPLQTTGTYGAEGEENNALFWTGEAAQFTLYPLQGVPLGSEDTVLKLTVLPASQGQTIEVFFNDQLVETKAFPPDSPMNWAVLPVKAKWREGANTLRLVGHGTPVYPPGDSRPFLFRVADPRRMTDDTGKAALQAASSPAAP